MTPWDELAHVAFEHVEKGHQTYISGRLVSDTVESDNQKKQTYCKVSGCLLFIRHFSMRLFLANTFFNTFSIKSERWLFIN